MEVGETRDSKTLTAAYKFLRELWQFGERGIFFFLLLYNTLCVRIAKTVIYYIHKDTSVINKLLNFMIIDDLVTMINNQWL